MTEPHRRSVITGGFALIAGGAITSVGTGDESVGAGTDADSSGSGTDVEGAADDGSADETGEDDTDAAASTLELSVSLPESIPAPEGRAEFLITVLNCGEKAVSAPITLEVGCVEDELETPTLAPGESADTYASYTGTRVGRGTHEWSVAVGTACEQGTLSVT